MEPPLLLFHLSCMQCKIDVQPYYRSAKSLPRVSAGLRESYLCLLHENVLRPGALLYKSNSPEIVLQVIMR